MTLTELRYIVTLAQEQHFGHAAERCHVSQPTLSVGVKKLEDELGVLIFERSKSAVRLTPVGEGIVAQAQKVLEQAQGIRELAQAGKNQLTAPLKVGAIYTVGPYLFPHSSFRNCTAWRRRCRCTSRKTSLTSCATSCAMVSWTR
ncbi:DNA-binding transcriptional LysR family regulator [Pseudomonas sp. PvP001]